MDHLWSSSGVQLFVGVLLLWIIQALAMCPPSFIDFEGRCYHFSSETFNARVSAVEYCQTFDNGKLDAPRKPEENGFFRQRIDDIPGGMPGAWIEPTDEEAENVWKCGMETCNYFNWRQPHEPNGGKNSNCVIMFVSDGRWGDNPCNDPDNAWHAICKLDMTPPHMHPFPPHMHPFPPPECPVHSILHENHCYHFTLETFMTRQGAKDYCRDFDDGRLYTPKGPTENNIILDYVRDIDEYGDDIWLDADDKKNEGNWECGRDPCHFLNWEPDMDHSMGGLLDCAIMQVYDGYWIHHSCDQGNEFFHAVCESDIPPPHLQPFPPLECPADSTQHENHCYHFTLETFLTRQGAKDYCSDFENGRLYTPKGPTGNNFIWDYMRDIDEHEDGIWLNADDERNEGNWECGRDPCHYLNWDPSMDHSMGDSLDCAIMQVHDGYWIHHPCDHGNEFFHAVCESDPVVIQNDKDSTTKQEETTHRSTTTVLTTTNRPTTSKITTVEITTDVKTTRDFTIHHTTEQSTFEPTTTEQTTIQKSTTHETTTETQTTQLATSSKPVTTVVTTEFTTTIPTTTRATTRSTFNPKTTEHTTIVQKPTTHETTTEAQTTKLATSSKPVTTVVTTEFTTTIPTTTRATTRSTFNPKTTEHTTIVQKPTTHETTTEAQTTKLATSSKPVTTVVTTEFTTTIPTTTRATTRSTFNPRTTEHTTIVQKPTTHETTTEAQTTKLATSSKPVTTVVTTEFTTTIPTTTRATTRSTFNPRTTEHTTIVQKPTTHETTTEAQTTKLATSSKPVTTVVTTEFTTTIPTTRGTTTLDATTRMTTSGPMLLEDTTETQTTRSGLLGQKKQLNCSHVLDVYTSESKYSSYLFQRTESFNSPKMVLETSRVRSSIMCAVSCLEQVNCSAILFHNADGDDRAVCELLGESLDGTNVVSLYYGVISYTKLICF